MRSATRVKLSYAHVVTALALVLTLGGVSYAAVSLPGKSVGTKQLKRNAVVGSQVKNGSLLAADVKGGLPAGQVGPRGDQGPLGNPGVPGSPSNANLTVLSGKVSLTTANEFFAPSGTSVADSNEPPMTMLSPARPMIARSLNVRLNDAPGVGKLRKFSVRVNNVITLDLTCTVTHPATTCTSLESGEDELLIPAGSRISILNVSAGGATTATTAYFGFTLEPSG